MTQTALTDKQKSIKRVLTVLKFLVLLGIIIGLPTYLVICHGDTLRELKDLNYVKALILQYRAKAGIFYILFQVVQILISVIPGQALQVAAGFAFGIPLGLLLSIIGALIGSVITYYLGKYLGRDMMHLIFGEEKIGTYIDYLNSKKGLLILFILYLIPGLPKDVINYVAGISSIKVKPFLTISMLGRIPGMLGSLVIGRQVYHGGYTSAVIILAAAAVLFLLGVIFRKRLMEYFNRWYDKVME